jgi:hypothetical protein
MRPEQAAGTRRHEMTRYLISFDDGAMTFPEEELGLIVVCQDKTARTSPLGVPPKVDGSSPSEGSAKAVQIAAFPVSATCRSSTCGGYGAVYRAFRSRSSRLAPVPRRARLV